MRDRVESNVLGVTRDLPEESNETMTLEHADRITELLRQGKRREAMAKHNAHVKAEFDRAKQGQVINLSDLMAGHEAFIIDEIRLKS